MQKYYNLLCFVFYYVMAYSYAFSALENETSNLVDAEKITIVFQNNNSTSNNYSDERQQAVNFSNGTRWPVQIINNTSINSINRQDRVHSLRNALQSAAPNKQKENHAHHDHNHFHHKITSEIVNTDRSSCGIILMKKVKIILVRALTTWVHMDSSSTCMGLNGSQLANKRNTSWVEVLASSILSVSRIGGHSYTDSQQCLARVAVTTVRLLLLDEIETTNSIDSLASILNCSASNSSREELRGISSTLSARIVELVTLSQKSVHPWRERAIADYGDSGDNFSAILGQLSRAQRRVLNETAPHWRVDRAACFNSDDTAHHRHEHQAQKTSVGEMFDSAAIDALLYLSLGYVPDAKCPSAGKKVHIGESLSEDSQGEDNNLGDQSAISPEFFEVSLKKILQIDDTLNQITVEEFDNLLASMGIGDVQSRSDDCENNHDDYNDQNSTSQNRCFKSGQLLSIYGLDNSEVISYENLTSMFPALIQQLLSNACTASGSKMASILQLTASQRFGFGTLSVLIVSAASMIFLLIIPSTKRQNYRYIMSALIALSASTMLGDALLHLLPQALAIHSHGSQGSDIDIVQVEDFVVKQLITLCAIYGFYLFEMLVSGRHHAKENDEHDVGGHGHGHSHIPDVDQLAKTQISHKSDIPKSISDGHHLGHRSSPDFVLATYDNWEMLPEHQKSSSQSVNTVKDENGFSESSQESPVIITINCQLSASITGEDNRVMQRETANPGNGQFCRSLKMLAKECVPQKTLGWMVIMGDAVHNVIDGIAIGAAFSEDLVSGVSTSIAIACHEIPHEVGDFAALLTAGLTWRGALVWNVIHTILAFCGLYVGLGIATEMSTRQWVFALTAGMFIYVSLTEMMPELTRVTDNFWRFFAWQNLGLLFGFGLMLLIAIFEDAMAVAIKRSYSDSSS